MFSSFLEKFHNVQDGISSSFKGLAMGVPVPKGRSDLNAGMSLLAHYQSAWQDLHANGEINAKLASVIDKDIEQIHDEIAKKKRLWVFLSTELAHLPRVIQDAESLVNSVGKLRLDLGEMEEDLIKLENLIELEEMNRKKWNEKMKLNLYREQKLEDMDKVRERLSVEHNKKMKALEEEESMEKEMKSSVYEEQFKRDLETYKTLGFLPSPRKEPKTQTSLEEVCIEQDTEELQKFVDS